MSDLSTPRNERSLFPWFILGLVTLVVVGLASWQVRAGREWLQDVQRFEYEAGLHTTTPLKYKETPPAGGPHHPSWQNCGVYRAPLIASHVVHSLEHGAVWITYRDDVSSADIELLEREHEFNDYTIISPQPDQAGRIVLSAWNHQLTVEDAGDDRVRKFVAYFAEGITAPEPGAPCDGGVDSSGSETPVEGPVMGISEKDAAKLIGMSESDAEKYAMTQGWTWRIGERDGESFALTQDYSNTRVTVSIENGEVTAAVPG